MARCMHDKPHSVSVSSVTNSERAACGVGTWLLRRWVKKELNQLPGVHLEFEPLTEMGHSCPSSFTNNVLAHLMREPLRCVNRKWRAAPCYWLKSNCTVANLLAPERGGGPASEKASHEISGFLVHHIYVSSASWPFLLAAPSTRLVILRRTNIVKRTVSNMLRVAEDGEDEEKPSYQPKPKPKATGAEADATAEPSKAKKEVVDATELLRQV